MLDLNERPINQDRWQSPAFEEQMMEKPPNSGLWAACAVPFGMLIAAA